MRDSQRCISMVAAAVAEAVGVVTGRIQLAAVAAQLKQHIAALFGAGCTCCCAFAGPSGCCRLLFCCFMLGHDVCVRLPYAPVLFQVPLGLPRQQLQSTLLASWLHSN